MYCGLSGIQKAVTIRQVANCTNQRPRCGRGFCFVLFYRLEVDFWEVLYSFFINTEFFLSQAILYLIHFLYHVTILSSPESYFLVNILMLVLKYVGAKFLLTAYFRSPTYLPTALRLSIYVFLLCHVGRANIPGCSMLQQTASSEKSYYVLF